MPATMDDPHSIIEFLQRPVTLDRVTITTPPTPLVTDIGTEQYFSWSRNFPSSLIAIQSKLNKLENFAYMKADIKIKVTINASPFVAGKLMLVYSPYEDQTPTPHKMNTYPRSTISAYPNCIIDLQLDTAVEFTIPFLSFKEAYNLTSKDLDYVSLYLYPLTELRTPSASNPVTLNFFASFQNITLYGPTLTPISDTYLTESQRLRRKICKMEDCELQKVLKTTAEIQIQTETKETGIISEIAGVVSNVAGALTGLPEIGAVASTVQWVSDRIGQVASIFGLSKPTSVSENVRISNVPGYGSTHIKTIDQGNSLALNNDYKLGGLKDVFQTNADEMEIEYVANNPAVTHIFQWKSGTPFFQEMKCFVPDLSGSKNVLLYPFQFCGQFFNRYRATYCFKISIAKTAFHSGRLETFFNVGQATPTTDADKMTEDSSNCFRAILDITNDTELTIKIPYISPTLWLDKGDVMGMLKLRSMGDLVYNTNVSDTVDIVIHRWAENVMFMDPCTPFIKPSDVTRRSHIKADIQIQLVNKASPNLVTFGKMSDEQSLNQEALLLAGGDYVQNFRPLTRIFQQYAKTTTDVSIRLKGLEESTYINVLSHIYKMRRGGTRLKIIANDYDYNMMTSRLKRTQANNVTPYHYTFPKINPVHEINIPFYTKYRRIINNIEATEGIETYDLPDVYVTTDAPTSHSKIYILRAGDDDFSMGWLIGIPPMDDSGSSNLIPVTPDTPIPVTLKSSDVDFGIKTGPFCNVDYDITAVYEDGNNQKFEKHNIIRRVVTGGEEVNKMHFAIYKYPDSSSSPVAYFYCTLDHFILGQPFTALFDYNNAIKEAYFIITESQ